MAFSGSLQRNAALALCLLLLVGSPDKTSAQGLLGNGGGLLGQGATTGLVTSVVNPVVNPVVGTVASILPGLAGIISELIPFTGLLNGLLQQAIVANNLTQFTSDITTQITNIVGVLLNASLPVPPPIRPDTEVPLYGFLGSAYNVTTSDGYRLGVFRVRSPSCNNRTAGVVVMPPSFLSNAGTFLYLKNDSLAYRFARRCYDVWLLSFRGDLYGRSHVNLSVTSQAFWDYNPYHWGAIDLPTQLVFVSRMTGSTKMQIVGYDIAGTAFAFMNHVHGLTYQRLVSSCSVMLPIMYMSQLRSIVFSVLGIVRDVVTLAGAAAFHGEVPFFSPVVHGIFYNLCGRISPLTCNYLFQLLAGPSNQIRYRAFPEGARNILDSISAQGANWFLQQVGHRRRMSYFDFGSTVNMQRYGQTTPPEVFLNRTVTPCRLYAMALSTTTISQDVLDSYNDLAPSARTEFYEYPEFNAIGPIFPEDADAMYNRVVQGVMDDTARFN